VGKQLRLQIEKNRKYKLVPFSWTTRYLKTFQENDDEIHVNKQIVEEYVYDSFELISTALHRLYGLAKRISKIEVDQ